jgi:23S rRNA pseudouridine2605 synthase
MRSVITIGCIHEGKKRHIRRMCAALGHPVRRLIRVRIGPLKLQDLPVGKWRRLTKREVRALKGETIHHRH